MVGWVEPSFRLNDTEWYRVILVLRKSAQGADKTWLLNRSKSLTKGQRKLYWKPWGYSEVIAYDKGFPLRDCLARPIAFVCAVWDNDPKEWSLSEWDTPSSGYSPPEFPLVRTALEPVSRHVQRAAFYHLLWCPSQHWACETGLSVPAVLWLRHHTIWWLHLD